MASWDIGAVQVEGSATDIGAVQAAAAVGGTTPKGPLHHPLWGALAGPIFCLFGILFSFVKRLI